MKAYRYMYYNLYRLWLKKKDEQSNAHINAVITLTFAICINLISMPLIIMATTGKKISLPMTTNAKFLVALILVAFGIINYLILARKKQHRKTLHEFENETKDRRKTGMRFIVTYLIITFGVPLYILFFTTI